MSTCSRLSVSSKYFSRPIVLSVDPYVAPDNYQVAAIYGGFRLLALFKSGGKAWTYVSKGQLRLASDVIYYESQFHAIDLWHGLTIIKSYSGIDHTVELETIMEPDKSKETSKRYLVESSSGELLNVERFLEEKDDLCQFVTCDFKVCKLNRSDRQPCPIWVEIECIGGDSLFSGDNHSFSLMASWFLGYRSNSIWEMILALQKLMQALQKTKESSFGVTLILECLHQFLECQYHFPSIYYTDDYTDIVLYKPFGPRDMGIFSLEDKSFQMHYTLYPSHKDMPPLIWIVPTPGKITFGSIQSGCVQ